ncbi:MAG: BtrH N-terminal domain-containing protein [Bacteroidales bacterium]|nr:BtrH N-terminal domain-containing protein [Bacteroidales bacterium]
MDKIIHFEHNAAQHCENGSLKNLLHHYGVDLSEPLLFGIGSGLYFMHIPFIKHEHLPLTMFRTPPVSICKNASKLLNFKLYHQKFCNRKKSMQKLDALLQQNIPVGLVVSLLGLPYFPMYLRGEFNGHHIVAFGKENDRYLISDTFPLISGIQTITESELESVRYTNSRLSPKGELFYIYDVSTTFSRSKAIVAGIKKTCRKMLKPPLSYFGIPAIFLLSNHMRRWEKRLDSNALNANLRQIVRLSEEAGTGGSGFRYMYAAFLNEAADILQQDTLHQLALEMTSIADLWRDFCIDILRFVKKRTINNQPIKSVSEMADDLQIIAKKEQHFFILLQQLIKTVKID